MNDYQDIINYKYEGPKNHPRMSRENRAAQFASFKALNGYEDELKETRRIVSSKIIISNDKKEEINRKLKNIIDKEVIIVYFIKDLKKDGGYYKKRKCIIKKIDLYKKEIVLDTKERININNIFDIIL